MIFSKIISKIKGIFENTELEYPFEVIIIIRILELLELLQITNRRIKSVKQALSIYRPEIHEWMNSNSINYEIELYLSKNTSGENEYGFSFKFMNYNDAMLFKMTWK